MTAPIEDRIRRLLSAEAGLLSLTDDLAVLAIARGRRIRRARRAGAAVTVTIALGVALTVPGGVLNSGGPRPAGSPSAPTTSTTPVLPPVTADPAYPKTAVDDLPTGPPPRVPYTLSAYQRGGGHLVDGPIRLPIPAEYQVRVFGRVRGGWFVLRALGGLNGPRRGHFGLLRTAGEFVPFGSAAGWDGALSPDGTEVAFPDREPDGTVRLVIASARTGARTAATAVDPSVRILGWNPSGLWYVTFSAGQVVTTHLWQSAGEPRIVPGAGWLQITRGTTRMLQLDAGGPGCVAVVTARSDGSLSRLWRRCGGSEGSTLSPDGAHVVVPDGTVTRLSDGHVNHIRELHLPADQPWEDSTDVLIEQSSGRLSETRQTVVRCDIVTSRCERAYDRTIPETPPPLRIALQRP